MSFFECESQFIEHEDGSSSFTLSIDPVATKCLNVLSKNPEGWMKNAVCNRIRIEGEKIYKSEMQRHIDNGTFPENVTKKSLILSYEKPSPEVSTTEIQ